MHLCQDCGAFSTYHIEERPVVIEYQGIQYTIKQRFAVCDNCHGNMPIEGVMLENMNTVRAAHEMGKKALEVQ